MSYLFHIKTFNYKKMIIIYHNNNNNNGPYQLHHEIFVKYMKTNWRNSYTKQKPKTK